MEFYVINSLNDIAEKKQKGCYLIKSNWDDWFQYETKFLLYYKRSETDSEKAIGAVKIGSSNMEGKTPKLEPNFKNLSKEYFSLGTDENYYIQFNEDFKNIREAVLFALNDISFDKNIYKIAKDTEVFKKSLSRDIPTNTILGRFRRLALGTVEKSEYLLEFNHNNNSMEFSVQPDTFPPSNIHSIIGRNSVGKSFLLKELFIELLTKNSKNINIKSQSVDTYTNSEGLYTKVDENYISKVIYVNFSGFEGNEIYQSIERLTQSGLKDKVKHEILTIYSKKMDILDTEINRFEEISHEDMFHKSLLYCFESKPILWARTIKLLDSDPLFRMKRVRTLFKEYTDKNEKDFKKIAEEFFNELSSGHKIVLLIITKLVEFAEEKTLLLIDEPELHLHPPLLGSFIRSLSDLLVKVNGFSILVTHSPIILQETPKNCTYILEGNYENQIIKRPNLETFGSNISLLTEEVFNLEIEDSGFYQIIDTVVKKKLSISESLKLFNDHLGDEGKSILYSKIVSRDRNLEDGSDECFD
ncbi:AAA family ATPase [Facklamia miroungae]|uniref:AAA domain-containing protein, putative AbiEii toxin, Type IV TA system n=1 Tax=Facklamia miroungae TaxID=120956 RepID=A0A1G7UUY2_9LACT|nr:AAA family ATPase [Facklamia miroungae]NKZ30132.1 ATP-binding protein [Facklamia miroungae]SDG51296.1 AAA domain-containing protein, putative AbiEii toxin, Type IV TA system [Facklamia miroungae]